MSKYLVESCPHQVSGWCSVCVDDLVTKLKAQQAIEPVTGRAMQEMYCIALGCASNWDNDPSIAKGVWNKLAAEVARHYGHEIKPDRELLAKEMTEQSFPRGGKPLFYMLQLRNRCACCLVRQIDGQVIPIVAVGDDGTAITLTGNINATLANARQWLLDQF